MPSKQTNNIKPNNIKSNISQSSLSNKSQNIQQLTTIRDFIRYGLTQFNSHDLYFGHGTDNSWDEIIALITHTLKININPDNSDDSGNSWQADILPHLLDAKLLASEKELLFNKIQQRVSERIPLAYLINQTYFCDLEFYVDKRVIIPRSPIAELIQNQFSPWIGAGNTQAEDIHSILDLCTGSGCIAIALAYYFPNANVDAIDLSDDALEITKINIKNHKTKNNIKNKITPIKSDLFNNLAKNKKYDLIISNPPYVNQQDLDSMPAEYHHEPRMALEAGKDGLELVDRILKDAIQFLNPDGLLIVEVGNSQYDLIKKYPDIPFTWLEFESSADGVFLLTYKQLLTIKKNI